MCVCFLFFFLCYSTLAVEIALLIFHLHLEHTTLFAFFAVDENIVVAKPEEKKEKKNDKDNPEARRHKAQASGHDPLVDPLDSKRSNMTV